MHPLLQLLHDAAAGRFPSPDASVDVFGPPPGPCDVVTAFTTHGAVASPLPRDELLGVLPSGDAFSLLDARFLVGLGDRLGSDPGSLDLLLAATDPVEGPEEPLGDAPDTAHPRVERAKRYRPEVRILAPAEGGGVLVMGRGVAGRLEVALEVDPDRREDGLGRRMLRTARRLAAQEPLFAQVAPGNAASLRTFLAAEFVPLGAEVLFPRNPGA